MRAFVLDFLSHFARFLIDWADRTDELYGRWPAMPGDERAAAALAMIEANLWECPPQPSEPRAR